LYDKTCPHQKLKVCQAVYNLVPQGELTYIYSNRDEGASTELLSQQISDIWESAKTISMSAERVIIVERFEFG